jgi:hypothetical protein
MIKISSNLIVGDKIQIGGSIYVIKKVETVFHNRPDNRIRLTFENSETILFLAHGIEIEVVS